MFYGICIPRRTAHVLALTSALILSPATAQTTAPSSSTPPAALDPAVDQAMLQRFQALFQAIEGKAPVPDSKQFTDAFNQQVTGAQLQQLLRDIHTTTGTCSIAGQMRAAASFISSFLLQCEKGYVPIDLAIEPSAPYRVHTLLIRPGYRKL